ncbi:transporter substrate-binding domain-containing protein [Bradyrhizobium sp. INPA03-11B]|uniref:transporter substrate-binding domain-containing protein n=1 Tax=Bradyrhizobium sp. INPA03-11B TaxID=418598 RepID=UPI00338F4AD3
MPSKIGFRLAISALAFGIAAASAYAEGAKTVINAATTTYYSPFGFKDPATNKLTGFNIDLFDAMATKMGAKVNWIESSFDQLLSSILTKRAEVVIGIADRPERRKSVNFVDYVWDRSVFFTLRANAASFPNMEALCGKRVAASRVTAWPDLIVKWSDANCTKAGKPAVAVLGTVSTPDSRLQLNQGRADAAVQGGSALEYQNALESSPYAIIGNLFASDQGANEEALLLEQGENQAIGFSKDDPEFGEALKKALAAVIADGTYQKLSRRWNLPHDTAIKRALINGQP